MKKLILFSLFIFINCKSVDTNLIGKYQTEKSSYTQKWINYISNNCIVVGVKLTLEKDSTFSITTCSYSGTGKWNVKNDSLILKFETQKLFLNSVNSNVQAELIDEKYLIKNNYLYQEIESENSVCKIKLTK
ncbi:hypothetical protein [Flavobacterium sp.]|uniref:hypothetical protein n=1 Tax=Flavobacterium sp. TaxID=239 RepID=UPI0026161FF2|nr:hypothetical protein [Flavobacterium sp.]